MGRHSQFLFILLFLPLFLNATAAKTTSVISTKLNSEKLGPDIQLGQLNEIGIYDRPPVARKKDVSRILIIGNAWVAGLDLPIQATVAKRLEFHLNQLSPKKIEVINGAFPQGTLLEAFNKLPRLLEVYKPDYVYLVLLEPEELIRLAAIEQMIERNAEGQVVDADFFTEKSLTFRAFKTLFNVEETQQANFLFLLNLKIGTILLGRQLPAQPNPAQELLKPFLRLLNEFQEVTKGHHATFVLLTSRLNIFRPMWSTGTRFDSTHRWFWKLLDPLVRRSAIRSERLLEVLRADSVSTIVNFQIGPMLNGLRKDSFRQPDAKLDYYLKASDATARLFAISIVAMDFK